MTVSLASEEECLRFHVDDEGEGIPPDERKRVLDLFAQAEGGGNAGGYGLGLAFCAMACQAHGGSVTIDASPTTGARLTVALPVAPPEGD